MRRGRRESRSVVIVTGMLGLLIALGFSPMASGQNAAPAPAPAPAPSPMVVAGQGVAQAMGGVIHPFAMGPGINQPGGARVYAAGDIKEVHGDSVVFTISSMVWKKGEGYAPSTVDDTFMTNDKTKVMVNGEEAALADLTPGMKAWIMCRKEGDAFVADSITVNLLVGGTVKSIAKNGFVLALRGSPRAEFKPEDWMVLVDGNTLKTDPFQAAPAGAQKTKLSLSDLHENDNVQVWYRGKEAKDAAGMETVTASRVMVFGRPSAMPPAMHKIMPGGDAAPKPAETSAAPLTPPPPPAEKP